MQTSLFLSQPKINNFAKSSRVFNNLECPTTYIVPLWSLFIHEIPEY